MSISVALTVTGEDKPGLIDLLSTTLASHDANWNESRLARLAGRFAGIVLVSVPNDKLSSLEAELAGLSTRGLAVIVTPYQTIDQPGENQRLVKLELIGQDHPGIIREISHALAEYGVNINELDSQCRCASWSGEVIFEASTELMVPETLSMDHLRTVLENLANELMVDITLDEAED